MSESSKQSWGWGRGMAAIATATALLVLLAFVSLASRSTLSYPNPNGASAKSASSGASAGSDSVRPPLISAWIAVQMPPPIGSSAAAAPLHTLGVPGVMLRRSRRLDQLRRLRSFPDLETEGLVFIASIFYPGDARQGVSREYENQPTSQGPQGAAAGRGA